MLTVITGPMFSGKTSKLQSIYRANIIAKNPVAAFKPSNDTRYSGEMIVSHDGTEIPSFVLNKDYPLSSFAVRPRPRSSGTTDILFFDECQFYESRQLKMLIKGLISCGRDVFCAGLSCDSEGEEFGAMGYLLATADHIIINKAVCSRCKGIGVATRTYRTTDETEQTVVGGADKYEPRCFKCWREDDDSDTRI
jgi:thymidine kinase